MGNKASSSSSNKKQERPTAARVSKQAPPSSKVKKPASSSVSPLSHKIKKDSQLMDHVTASLKAPNSTDVWQDFEKVELIAKGSTCQVWTVQRNKSKMPTTTTKAAPHSLYALKEISKQDMTPEIVEEMRNEVAILRSLDHPNILRVYDWYETPTHSYMVMEYCSGGNLLSSDRCPYTEPQVAQVMIQVLGAMVYIHKRGIAHRDVKPENIVYAHKGEEAPPKLIDFGLSKQSMGHGQPLNMKCRVGTLLCMSPEVIRGKYTNKADIWSVGTVAYTLLSNTRPFDGSTDREIINNILDYGKYKPMQGPVWNEVSDLAKDFCAKLMTYNPDKRPTAKEALAHAWLRKYKSTTRITKGSSQESKNTTNTMNSIHSALLDLSRDENLGIFEGIVAMMAAYQTPNESLQEYRDAFVEMDPTNSGTITNWQFRAALQKGPCNLDETTMKKIFQKIDLDNNGSINYTEFLALALLAQGGFDQDEISAVFSKIDIHGNGFISREDLCSVLGPYCAGSTCDETVASILARYGSDKDGKFCNGSRV
jgi:calcium-dependent protein kinase